MKVIEKYNLTPVDINRIVEMAWEDRTPFDAITAQFGLAEAEVIELMKYEMKLSNWKKWRARVQGRATKHLAKLTQIMGETGDDESGTKAECSDPSATAFQRKNTEGYDSNQRCMVQTRFAVARPRAFGTGVCGRYTNFARLYLRAFGHTPLR